MSHNTTTFDLLRHGHCVGGDRLRGRLDDPLSELGWQQLHASTEQVGGWNRIISSPLTRCRAFAETLASGRSVPLEVEQDLREIDFGSWEGRQLRTLWQECPTEVGQYFSDPGSYTPPGGEPLPEASARVVSAFDALKTRYLGQHLLLVVHGGVIRMLLAALMGAPLNAINRFSVAHGCMSRLQLFGDGGNPVLQFHQPCAIATPSDSTRPIEPDADSARPGKVGE